MTQPTLSDLSVYLDDGCFPLQPARSLQNAKRLGAYLECMRKVVWHGSWQRWITEYCRFSQKTAFTYIKIHRHWNWLIEAENLEKLSITGAMHIISKKKAQERAGRKAARRQDQDAIVIKGDFEFTGFIEQTLETVQHIHQIRHFGADPGTIPILMEDLGLIQAKLDDLKAILAEFAPQPEERP